MIPNFPHRQGSINSEESTLAANLLKGNLLCGVRLVNLRRAKGHDVSFASLVNCVCPTSDPTLEQFDLIADAWALAEQQRELARFRQRMLACGIADEDTPDPPVAQVESD